MNTWAVSRVTYAVLNTRTTLYGNLRRVKYENGPSRVTYAVLKKKPPPIFHFLFAESVPCPNSDNFVATAFCTRDLPDLVFDTAELTHSLHLEDRMMYFLQCAMEENCLASEAYTVRNEMSSWATEMRRLLKFTAKTLNAGTADFRPHIPKEMWEWHHCHM